MSMIYQPEDVILTKENKAFRVHSSLGAGGMSEVYRALDHSMGRSVVIKLLSRRARKHAARFIQEAKLLANVDHPNVARVFERGETNDGDPYYTMEHLDAWSLREILVSRAQSKKYGFTWEVALNITSQLLYGLGALHEAGIVHRDVKPENVLLAKQRDGRQIIKIIDPGIAKLLDDDRLEGLVATPMYAAPDQLCETTTTPNPQVDVFAAGLVLYELITGRYAYSVYGNDLEGAIERRNKPVPEPSMLRRDVPPAVDALVALMTALDPNHRPSALAAMQMAENIGLAKDAAEQVRRSPKGAPIITESGLREHPRREARITRADLDAPTDPDGNEVSPNLRYMQMLAEHARGLGYDEVAYVREHTKGISPDELDRRYLMGVQETSPEAEVPRAERVQGSVVIAPSYMVGTQATSQAKEQPERAVAQAPQVDRSAPTQSAKVLGPNPTDTPLMDAESHTRAALAQGNGLVVPPTSKGGTVPMRPAFLMDHRAGSASPAPHVAPVLTVGTVPMGSNYGDPSEHPAGVVMNAISTKPSTMSPQPRGVVARTPPPVQEDSVVIETYRAPHDDVPSRSAVTPAAGRAADRAAGSEVAPRKAGSNAKSRIAGAPLTPRKANDREELKPAVQPLWPFFAFGLAFILVVVAIGIAWRMP